MASVVPEGAKLLVVGGHPEKTEASQGRPFVSATNKMLRTAIQLQGLDESEVAFVNTVQCPFDTDKGKPVVDPIAQAKCTVLEDVMSTFTGRVVMASGKVAADRLLGVKYTRLMHKSRCTWDGYIHDLAELPDRIELGKELWYDEDDPIKSGPNKGSPRMKKRPLFAVNPPMPNCVGIGATIDPMAVRLSGFSLKPQMLAAVQRSCEVALGAEVLGHRELAGIDSPLHVTRPDKWVPSANAAECALIFDIENTPEGITHISFVELAPNDEIQLRASFAWSPAVRALAKTLLGSASPYKERVAHNAAYDCGQLAFFESVHVRGANLGARGKGLIDTMMAGHLHMPDLAKALGAMWRYMPPMRPTKHLSGENMMMYNLIDSTFTGRVWAALRRLLSANGQMDLLRDECASIMVLDRMTRNGLPMDVRRLEDWITTEDAVIADLESQWFTQTGLKVQAGKAVLNWVFVEQGAPVLGTTATGQPQLNGDIMDKLAESDNETLAKAMATLRDLKKRTKLVSTYGRGFLEKLDDKGYLHPSYLPDMKDSGDLGTAAGRLSSSPNVQNIPKSMRWAIKAPKGWVIGDSDLSAVEGRVQATLAQDHELLDMYDRPNFDMHTYNLENAKARLLLVWQEGVAQKTNSVLRRRCRARLAALENGVWPVIRANMKTFLYGWNYGAGDNKIASSLGLYLFEATAIREAYELSRPATAAWRSATVKNAAIRKHLQNAFGRRRYFFGVVPDTHVRNQAINFFPQSTVADMFWTWFPEVEELLAEHGGHLITQVHDSFVWLLPEVELLQFVPRLDKLMNRTWDMIAPGFSVPSSHDVGHSWGEVKTFVPDEWRCVA